MQYEKIALIFGGRSAEHEVSIMSARSVYKELLAIGFEAIPILISKDGYWLDLENSKKVINGDIDQIKNITFENQTIFASLVNNFPENVDLVFPLMHGPFGEDGKIQGFLEVLDIPYVGAGTSASAVSMDKIYSKNILSKYNLPQTKYITISESDWAEAEAKQILEIKSRISEKISYPLFVKPANLGSSIGISRVTEEEKIEAAIDFAFKYDNRILIEAEVTGREIECSILEVENGCISSKPGEIIPANEFYDYEAKYYSNDTILKTPADLNNKLENRIRHLAEQTFQLLNCSCLARIDFFLDNENNIFVNEINTMPGFTPKSMYARMWEASGLNYSDLLEKLIEIS
ncbi:MAG: D-alanine--D-alanine ligase family protein [Halarsenatibacteraceae bacterium]